MITHRAIINTPWNDKLVEDLKRMWCDEGLSSSAIAANLGPTFTRNSIISKVHRLGLVGGSQKQPARSPVPSKTAHKPAPRHVKPFRAHLAAKSQPVVEVQDGMPALKLTITQLSDRVCRFPIGDPTDKDFHFCGHKTKFGYPYCADHCTRAFQPMHPRKSESL